MKNWIGVLAVASLTVACGGGAAQDPEAATGLENPAMLADDTAPAESLAPEAGNPASSTASPAPAASGAAAAGSNLAPAAGSSTSSTSSAAAEQPAASEQAAASNLPEYREFTLPAGTSLPLRLQSTLASDSSRVEDAVRAELREAIVIDGREVIPAGAELAGNITEVAQSGRVRGRARLAYRFTALDASGTRYDIRTDPVAHEAEATRGEDATKIAVGAGAGAAIGAILGGGDGAAKGAAIGGAAGTGAVLATRGEEVRLSPGTNVTARLATPLTVRVRVN